MKRVVIVLVLVGVVLFAGVGFVVVKQHQQTLADTVERERVINSISFSGTQQWDPSILSLQERGVVFAPLEILLPQPPLNVSDETRMELEFLHMLEVERTPQMQEEIEAEVLVETTVYNGDTFASLVNALTRPETYRLFTQTHAELLGHIVRQKNFFNRVRPSLLDPTLQVAIEIPGHPAYPSGHATESYFLALLFSELDPGNHEIYIRDAQRIAHNREIAGLHYPSDSRAGVVLAKAYMEQLKEDTWYQQQLAKAKTEWNQ